MSGSDRQLVTFSLHGEDYAVPIASVREIIRYTPPTATAAARGLVKGMIALRGRVLPVVDLSESLGQTPGAGDQSRILVLEVSTGELGLVVDGVHGVVLVTAEQVARVPVPVTHEGVGEEVATIDDRLVILIEPERALGPALAPPAPPEPAPPEPAPPEPAPPEPAEPPPTRRRTARAKSTTSNPARPSRARKPRQNPPGA